MFKRFASKWKPNFKKFGSSKLFSAKNRAMKWITGGMITGVATGSLVAVFNKQKGKEQYIRNLSLPIEYATKTYAPHVPPPIERNYPARVKVDIDVEITRAPLDASYDFEYWTFDGHAPGPFIRTRVGDILEVTLNNNDDSGMLHNIDFHSVAGQGGGAAVLTPAYGESKTAEFKMLYPGLYIYHCAVDPIGVHIGTGMYGLMLVEPEGGLPKVDKEFYVLQSEFYTEEEPYDDDDNLIPFSMDRGLDENPNYVVFNGSIGSLTQENTLKAKVGERIRFYLGNAGPNLISSFHIIGTVMDKVYREGDMISPPARGLQTTLIPAGGAAVVEFDAVVPGTYTLVDHSIWRVEKGCVGFIAVEGEGRPDIYYSDSEPAICPSCKIHP